MQKLNVGSIGLHFTEPKLSMPQFELPRPFFYCICINYFRHIIIACRETIGFPIFFCTISAWETHVTLQPFSLGSLGDLRRSILFAKQKRSQTKHQVGRVGNLRDCPQCRLTAGSTLSCATRQRKFATAHGCALSRDCNPYVASSCFVPIQIFRQPAISSATLVRILEATQMTSSDFQDVSEALYH